MQIEVRYSRAIAKKSAGFTLVEVLVSLIILAIGVMGLISLQVGTLQANQAVSQRSQAVWAASDIVERMRANRTAVLNGEYNLALSNDAPTSLDNLSAADLSDWIDYLETWLPEGDGAVNYNPGSGLVTVTIQWDDSAMRDGSSEKQFVFGTQI